MAYLLTCASRSVNLKVQLAAPAPEFVTAMTVTHDCQPQTSLVVTLCVAQLYSPCEGAVRMEYGTVELNWWYGKGSHSFVYDRDIYFK
jgi:hypothetical protein